MVLPSTHKVKSLVVVVVHVSAERPENAVWVLEEDSDEKMWTHDALDGRREEWRSHRSVTSPVQESTPFLSSRFCSILLMVNCLHTFKKKKKKRSAFFQISEAAELWPLKHRRHRSTVLTALVAQFFWWNDSWIVLFFVLLYSLLFIIIIIYNNIIPLWSTMRLILRRNRVQRILGDEPIMSLKLSYDN